MKIESLQNKKVKEWVKLKEKKYRDRTNLFLIEGEHLVEEAAKNGSIRELISLNDEHSDYIVTKEIMKKLTSQNTIPNCIAVCEKLKEQKPYGNVLLLDGIQDPGNLGTIVRCATAFSYNTIILSDDCVDLYNDKTIRATEGMFFHRNILRADLKEEILKLKKDGYHIYGTNVKDGTLLKEISFSEKKAIIIGSEGKGVREKIKSEIDENIYIPMDASCESLNAAISASIIMYESVNS